MELILDWLGNTALQSILAESLPAFSYSMVLDPMLYKSVVHITLLFRYLVKRFFLPDRMGRWID